MNKVNVLVFIIWIANLIMALTYQYKDWPPTAAMLLLPILMCIYYSYEEMAKE